jgi:hypothetical protein
MKCIACPLTGCMINLEIQRGKEGMKDAKYNHLIGAMSGCTLRMLEDAIQEGERFHGVIGDAWFGSIRTAAEVGRCGQEVILQVKQYSALYPKAFIEETLEDAPAGVWIVLETTHFNRTKLIAVGYHYRLVFCRFCFSYLFCFKLTFTFALPKSEDDSILCHDRSCWFNKSR